MSRCDGNAIYFIRTAGMVINSADNTITGCFRGSDCYIGIHAPKTDAEVQAIGPGGI